MTRRPAIAAEQLDLLAPPPAMPVEPAKRDVDPTPKAQASPAKGRRRGLAPGVPAAKGRRATGGKKR